MSVVTYAMIVTKLIKQCGLHVSSYIHKCIASYVIYIYIASVVPEKFTVW